MEGRQTEREDRYCRWVEQHSGLIYRIVHGTVERRDEMNDLFQEILLQLWRSMPSFEGNCKETTWIYRVALNTARAWRRTEWRRERKHREFARFSEFQESTESPDPRLAQLYEAIRNLPKAQASLLLLHLEGLSYQEISEVLGVSEGCVGVRLTRAKKQLADRMKGERDGI